MSKSVSVIFLKQESTDKEGTLYIRTIESRASKRKSLGIKIKESNWKKYFNPKTLSFKSDKRFADGISINEILRVKLKELSKNENELAYLPDEKKSFTKYWEKYIQTIQNFGTKIKHEVVLAKLNKFLVAKDKSGLLFIEITPAFLRELKLHFSQSKDPKTLSENTVNHYLKIIKSIIRKASEEDYYVFTKDPFLTIKFNNKKAQKNVLNAEELFSIIKGLFWDENLNIIRDMFLFQIFANGMRVSDLFLLRWNNFSKGRLSYDMFKTSLSISMPVNANLAGILHTRLGTTENHSKLLEIFSQPVIDIDGNTEKLTLEEIDKRINLKAFHELEINDIRRDELNGLVEKRRYVKYKDYFFKSDNEINLIYLIDAKEKLLKYVDDLYVSNVFSQIRIKKNDCLNEFVFPILDNEAFKNIDEKNDFTKITLEQYKMVKNATIIYNRKLKSVQEACSIKTTLTSHVARHSFTNLLLTMNDVNLYDISQSLGHSSISITQNYINSGFNTEKVDYINKEFAKIYRKKNL